MKNTSAAQTSIYSASQTNRSVNNRINGLTSDEAFEKLQQYGRNEIIKKRKTTPLKIFLHQFSDFMVIILMLATFFSLCMGETVEALTIIFVIVVNAILGFWQEFKTERTLEALKNLAAPNASVVRDGSTLVIPANEVVPGDIILIDAGSRIPADAVLLEAQGLTVDESMLTGESIPAEKKPADKIPDNISEPGEPSQNIFMGTIAVSGKARAAVIHTGMKTEMGKIADMIQNVEDDLTPLQKKLDRLGTHLVYGCIIICAVVSLIGILKGESVFNMILSGISLAVAAIPEGMPAVVTISLAIGVQRMLKKNALIRRLPAVETLGCSTVICSDKTGTLTENKMVVKKAYAGMGWFDVTGSGFSPEGDFITNGKSISPKDSRFLVDCLTAGALCNNASLTATRTRDKGKCLDEISWSINGDPTEGALLVAAAKAGITHSWLKNIYSRVFEIPFDSDRKMMSVVYRNNHGKLICFTKGAPDILIDSCTHVQGSEGILPLDRQTRSHILEAASSMAGQALRVIAVAKKSLPSKAASVFSSQNPDTGNLNLEKELIFLGLVGMIDPPRKEAVSSIVKCKKAGIKPVMITGDHKQTAAAVAKDLGILDSHGSVMTGDELDKLSDKQLLDTVRCTSVYARVSPRHKLKIVKSLKRNGHIVAMTGDGVNDSPAVKEADIGVAMGIAGTDVTKESSSMILLDDNFSTIVSAVEEGRGIYNNIRKFIRYMLSCNIGEVLTMFLGAFLSAPVPLIPIQILWVNLVTDGLPGIALGLDPNEKGIMERKPRPPNEHIFSDGLLGIILLRGVIIGLGTLAVFCIEYYLLGAGLAAARTAAFATLVLSQLIHVFECRSEKKDIFQINVFENKYLVWAVIISLFMLLAVLYIPYLQYIFKTTVLTLNDWMFIIGFSIAGPAISSMYMSIKKAVKGSQRD